MIRWNKTQVSAEPLSDCFRVGGEQGEDRTSYYILPVFCFPLLLQFNLWVLLLCTQLIILTYNQLTGLQIYSSIQSSLWQCHTVRLPAHSMAASSLILIHRQIKYKTTKTKSLRVPPQSSKLLLCSVVVELIIFIRHACNLWNTFNSSLILPTQPYLAKMLPFLLLKYMKHSAAEQLEQMRTSS